MTQPIRMGSAAVVVGAGVALSRVLGLAREALLAAFFGLEVEGDLYRQAFLIPDFLNYLLAGAYLTITLIPILSRHMEKGDTRGASAAFTSVFRFVAVAIVALTALMWVFADQLVSVVFPEVADPARLASLTRVVLPAQVFLVVGALMMAVQYAHRRFVLPALAPIVYNLGIIGGGLVAAALGDPTPESFLWGAVVGSAVGNFALQWLGARRTTTWLIRPNRGESAVAEYLLLALPLMIGQSIAVLDEQFVRLFGQVEEGTTSALLLARQLNMVPVGVIAQAAGVAAFPFLARLAERADVSEVVEATGRAARNTVFVAAAATAGLVVLARPMVRILYQYREFSSADAELVATLLTIYAFSIPAWGLHQLLARHFYAKRRMWTPVLIGTAFTVIAVPVWLGLHATLGVEGFALASTLIMTGYALGLLVAWGYDSGWAAVRRLVPALIRALAAAGVAAVVGLPLVNAFIGQESLTVWSGLGVVLIGGLTTLATFLGVSALMRSPELRDVLSH
ncbi:MAG TPA: lipid II flippase MurJ [Acidimicrobiia bacterium]|jgi:putative peptidoglycan lipid II flippase